MRIITNFKDYYDGLQDPTDTLVYKRFEEEIEKPKFTGLDQIKDLFRVMPGWPNRHNEHPLSEHITCNLIACCGKLYPSYDLYLDYTVGDHREIFEVINRSFNSMTEVHQAVLALPDRTHSKVFDDHVRTYKKSSKAALTRKYRVDRWWMSKYDDSAMSAAAYAKELENTKVDETLFRELDSPVFMLDIEDGAIVLIKNPQLAHTALPKVLPPWHIYQELDMFLGNNLAKQEEKGWTGSDEVRRDQHGFDDMSFKQNAPGQKKLRRKENKLRKRLNGSPQT